MADTLRNSISNATKEAMKAGDKKRLSTLRLMSSAIKDKDINSRTDGHDSVLTPDSGLVELFAKMVKQRQESVAVYEQGGRPELAQNERDEIAIGLCADPCANQICPAAIEASWCESQKAQRHQDTQLHRNPLLNRLVHQRFSHCNGNHAASTFA